MKTLGIFAICAFISFGMEARSASCDAIPANSKLPLNSVNGYTISNSTPGTSTHSDQNGSIQLNGGLTINFDEEHVGTILEFLGGTVGDVTASATGGTVPPLNIAVPKTPGSSVKAAMYTRGVKRLDLVSQNNEGLLASICSAD